MKNPITKGAITGISVAALMIFGLTACGEYNDARGKGDAPVSGKRGDDSPAEAYNMPDGFGNVATKCVGHGFRAYVTTNTGHAPSNLVIIKDESC